MSFDRTDYILVGMALSGMVVFTADDFVLPQTGYWWVLGEVGIGLLLAAIIAGVIVALRRLSRPRNP